jgi:hypothetical protein
VRRESRISIGRYTTAIGAGPTGTLTAVRRDAGDGDLPAPNEGDLAAVTWSGTRRQLLRASAGAAGAVAAVSLHFGQEALRSSQSREHSPAHPVLFTQASRETLLAGTRAFPDPLDVSAAELRRVSGTDSPAYRNFVQAHRGAWMWLITQEIGMQVRDKAVVITNISARITKKMAPLTGTLFWTPPSNAYIGQGGSSELASTDPATAASTSRQVDPPTTEFVPAGAVVPFSFGVDLDSRSTAVREFDDKSNEPTAPVGDQLKKRPYFEGNTLYLAPGDALLFRLTASSTKHHCNAAWVFDYVTQGTAGAITSRPYAVTAGAGQWPTPTQPDFSAYKRLFVLTGSPENPRWRSQDPHRYHGE